MDKKFIENRLRNALNRLYHFDSLIISNNSNERSITHRLAVHLGTLFFEDWNVDVEYNRNLGDRKQISWLARGLDEEDVISGRKSVYPDIIVHKRNSSENLLVVEVKKMGVSERLEQYDIEKLNGYFREETLKYEYAAFVKISDPNMRPKKEFLLRTRDEWLANGTSADFWSWSSR